MSGPPLSVGPTPVREITASSAERLIAAMGPEGDRVVPRLGRGCRAFVVFDAGRVVSYGWLSITSEWIGEFGIQITPAGREGYVWNCVTLPEHRRRGNYRALLDGIVAQARADGLRRLWIGSVEHPAEKANADAGFVTVLKFTVRRFAGLRWVSATAATTAAPNLADEARQRLGLRSLTWVGADRDRKH